jgi:hypothetical protein
VTAVGTGGKRFAQAFIDDERVPFEVLLDADGSAAKIAGTGTIGVGVLARPAAYRAAMRAFRAGNRQASTGPRPMQLGATLVVGPGDELIYADFEEFAGDHAPLEEVLAALAD